MLTKHYLIRPGEALAVRAAASGHDWVGLVTQTLLWKKSEGDRTRWTADDRHAFVKLVFLASVAEYREQPGFSEVVDHLSFDTDCFDRNWTLTEVDEVEDVDEVAMRLAETSLAGQIQSARPVVDEALASVNPTTWSLSSVQTP